MRASQMAVLLALGGLPSVFVVPASYADGSGSPDGIENAVLAVRNVMRGAGGGSVDGWSNGAATLVPKGDGAYGIVY